MFTEKWLGARQPLLGLLPLATVFANTELLLQLLQWAFKPADQNRVGLAKWLTTTHFSTMSVARCRPIKLPCEHLHRMTVYNPNSGSSVAMQQTYRGHASQLPTLLGKPAARRETKHTYKQAGQAREQQQLPTCCTSCTCPPRVGHTLAAADHLTPWLRLMNHLTLMGIRAAADQPSDAHEHSTSSRPAFCSL